MTVTDDDLQVALEPEPDDPSEWFVGRLAEDDEDDEDEAHGQPRGALELRDARAVDPLGLLLHVVTTHTSLSGPHYAPDPLTVEILIDAAERRGVELPAVDLFAMAELELIAARRALNDLRADLATALLGVDDAAAREALNRQLAGWSAVPALDEDLGPGESPTVHLVAGACAHGVGAVLGPLLRTAAAVLLTEALRLHLDGLRGRVRACASADCRTAFMDESRSRRQRYCSPRCRAREHARTTG